MAFHSRGRVGVVSAASAAIHVTVLFRRFGNGVRTAGERPGPRPEGDGPSGQIQDPGGAKAHIAQSIGGAPVEPWGSVPAA